MPAAARGTAALHAQAATLPGAPVSPCSPKGIRNRIDVDLRRNCYMWVSSPGSAPAIFGSIQGMSLLRVGEAGGCCVWMRRLVSHRARRWQIQLPDHNRRPPAPPCPPLQLSSGNCNNVAVGANLCFRAEGLIPMPEPQATWTCGAKIDGPLLCANTGGPAVLRRAALWAGAGAAWRRGATQQCTALWQHGAAAPARPPAAAFPFTDLACRSVQGELDAPVT